MATFTRVLPGRQPRFSKRTLKKITVAANKFRHWLDEQYRKHGLQRHDVARLLKVSPQYPGMLANGRAKPGLAVASRIEELTEGAVPSKEWQLLATPRAATKLTGSAARVG